ncbi:MAG TPA: hypothetical protein VMU43_12810 [Candidatus Acidoferrum sp.]|nr:hypothetical protein [Candidatus Acidoferrum sp.]
MSETKIPTQPQLPEPYEKKRRTQRVQIMMPVIVKGTYKGQVFEEKTHTVTVNAHGCLVLMKSALERAQEVMLINSKTAEELPCQVMFLGQKEGDRIQVGLQFAERSPLFWRIMFPPEDWDPSQRKRHTGSASVLPKPTTQDSSKK